MQFRVGTAYVEGLQSAGVAATPKHFVANDSETERMTYEAVIEPRPLRELYLRPFEEILRDARPWLVMAASIVLLVFAEFCFVAGVWRELTGKEKPQPDAPQIPAWLLVFFNGFMVLLGLAVLVGIVTR